MKVLVTGAAGFIGSRLCDDLLARGDSVVGLDNFNPHYPREIKERNLFAARVSDHFDFHELDILDFDALNNCVMSTRPDRVVHLANEVGSRITWKTSQQYLKDNLKGTTNLLDAVASSSVSSIVLASSSKVYANDAMSPLIEEGSLLASELPYSLSKLACENMARSYGASRRRGVSVLRLFAVYGPRQRSEAEIHHFTRCIDTAQPINIRVSMDSQNDYLFVGDCVQAIMSALEIRSGFRILNIGSGAGTSLRKLIYLLEKALGMKAVLEMNKGETLPTYHVVAGIEAARKALDFSPDVNLEAGIGRFIAWYREQPVCF